MINRQLPARNEYRCDVCGKVDIWGPGWKHCSSLLMEEVCPDEIPHVCSDACAAIADKNLKSGEWKLPKLKQYGYQARVTQHGSGYGKRSDGNG